MNAETATTRASRWSNRSKAPLQPRQESKSTPLRLTAYIEQLIPLDSNDPSTLPDLDELCCSFSLRVALPDLLERLLYEIGVLQTFRQICG
jgi:hypothetical protein